ncbi:PTS transporter subunit EIIB [Faecalibaculum rodentium]|uniref:PTS transporter subunit EIIB n=1 Tax=Faecalibaculum rodentium TaxID=1702221 RepID=UPI0024917288|nr:PTS transporter subunit EIIB [Faecalibaculum rodentium]
MVKYVGGSSNIQSVTNCMTRLRLILKDPARADIKALQALDGMQGVVTNVKNEATKLGGFEEGTAASGKRKTVSMPWWVR